MNNLKYLLFLTILTVNVNVKGEELGRLFTTPQQRQILDQMRLAKPETDHVVVINDEPFADIEEEEFIEEEIIEDEPESALEGPLSLKGVVYRENGSNTAWINDDNTFDGNLGSHNIDVSNSDIKKDQVKVKIPGDVTEITLKVGETYEPIHESSPEVSDN